MAFDDAGDSYWDQYDDDDFGGGGVFQDPWNAKFSSQPGIGQPSPYLPALTVDAEESTSGEWSQQSTACSELVGAMKLKEEVAADSCCASSEARASTAPSTVLPRAALPFWSTEATQPSSPKCLFEPPSRTQLSQQDEKDEEHEEEGQQDKCQQQQQQSKQHQQQQQQQQQQQEEDPSHSTPPPPSPTPSPTLSPAPQPPQVQTPGHASRQQSHQPNARRSKRGPLRPGSHVKVGSIEAQVVGELGEGSFGIVWEAKGVSKQSIAIKEIKCNTPLATTRAQREVRLLRSLASNSTQTSGFVPRFLAESGEETSELLGHSLLLAMEKIVGATLLETLESPSLLRIFGSSLLGSPDWPNLPVPISACGLLLSQLSQPFELLSTLAVHRDAHARNILVELRPGSLPRFVLIDFGLAEESDAWLSGGWLRQGPAGDSRYWSPAAWAHFQGRFELLDESDAGNQEEVEQTQQPQQQDEGLQEQRQLVRLSQEYKYGLDAHSLALTALQALAALVPTGGEACNTSEFHNLEEVWATYWVEISDISDMLHRAFQASGSLDAARSALASVSAWTVAERHTNALQSSSKRLAEAISSDNQNEIGSDKRAAKHILESITLLLGSNSAAPTSLGEVWKKVAGLLPAAPPIGFVQEALEVVSEAGTATDRSLSDVAAPDALGTLSKTSSADSFWDDAGWDPDSRVYIGSSEVPTSVQEEKKSALYVDWTEEECLPDLPAVQWPDCALARQALAAAPFDPVGMFGPNFEDPEDHELAWDAERWGYAVERPKRWHEKGFWDDCVPGGSSSPESSDANKKRKNDASTGRNSASTANSKSCSKSSNDSPCATHSSSGGSDPSDSIALVNAGDEHNVESNYESDGEQSSIADDDYWGTDQWDPDERVYVGADAGQHHHTTAVLPKNDIDELLAQLPSGH